MKKSFFKNFALGFSAIAVFFMAASCEMGVEEPGATYAVSGTIDNYNTSYGGFDAKTGISIEFDAENFTSDWDSIVVQTQNVRIMAPNLGYWPSGTWFGNVYPALIAGSLKNGAAWDFMLNKSSNNRVKISLDSTNGIRYYLNDVLMLHYAADKDFPRDATSSVTSINSIKIKEFVEIFFEDIKEDVTFGAIASGTMKNLVVTGGVLPMEQDGEATSYPYNINGTVAGKTVKLKNVNAATGVTFEFVAENFTSDWDCTPVKSANAKIHAPNIDIWNGADFIGNKFPATENKKNGYDWDALLNKTTDNTFKIAIDNTNGIRFYHGDTLAIHYPVTDAVGATKTVADFITTFFAECGDGVDFGTYANTATGAMKNLVIKTGVPGAAPAVDANFGTFLCLDSTDGGSSYNMTIDSIKKNGTDQGNTNITTDVYIADYTAATGSSDNGVKKCAVLLGKTGTVEYTISDITVTGKTPASWGIFNAGFTDTANGKYYAIRSDGWDNNKIAPATKTGTWATGDYTDGENILISAPYNTGKIKIKIEITTTQASLTVYSVNGSTDSELSKATWTL